MLTYSSPAKVIISGEHSVVYGKPALCCPINRRLYFSVSKGKQKKKDLKIESIAKIVIDSLAINYPACPAGRQLPIPNYQLSYTISSDIPIGRGLGASAALSTSAVASIYHFYTGKSPSLDIINQLAFEAEKIFHGHPSGVDNTTSCFGRLLYFRREFDFLKTIYLLPEKIPAKIENNLYLIDSGKPIESTAEMVDKNVRTKYQQSELKMNRLFNDIEIITKKITQAIINNNPQLLASGLKINQRLLYQIGVVSEKTQKIINQLENFAFAKISGAGGKKENSGFILVYCQDKKKLTSFCQEKKLMLLKFNQAQYGCRHEK